MKIFKANKRLFELNICGDYHVYVNQGGTSSGKTYTILQVLIYIAISQSKQIITVVGQDLPNLKVGAFRDLKSIIEDNEWLAKFFKFNNSTFKATGINGTEIEFKSYEDEQDAKSGKRDYLFINEANGISYEVYWQLAIRTRKKIWIDYNPSARFWVHDKVIGRKDTQVIYSNHYANRCLTDDERGRINGIEDGELRKVYLWGKTGKLSGLIFPNYRIVDDMPPLADVKIHGYGLDFGFSADPTALIEVSLAHGEIWLDQRIYERGMTNPMIAERMKDEGITRRDYVVADSAEPKSIAEIKAFGLWIVPAVKGVDSITVGIDVMHRYKINVTRRSTGLIEEFNSYKYKKDRDGKQTNDPVDKWNHGIDAVRYFALRKLNIQRTGTARAHYNRLD